jgi:hypothetical protein
MPTLRIAANEPQGPDEGIALDEPSILPASLNTTAPAYRLFWSIETED